LDFVLIDLILHSFDDVKIIERIGAGGGGGSIFSANWNETKVCFKVFNLESFQSPAQVCLFVGLS